MWTLQKLSVIEVEKVGIALTCGIQSENGTCDPAVDYLKLYSKMPPDDIVRHMINLWFDGVS